MAKFVPFYSMGVEIPETKLSEEEIQLFKETLEDHSYIISDETSRKILFAGRHGKVFLFNKLTGRVEVAKNPVKDSEFDLVNV